MLVTKKAPTEISFGKKQSIIIMTKQKAIDTINSYLKQFHGQRVVLIVQGSCNTGKSTFCKQIKNGEVPLIYPPQKIAYILGNLIDDILKKFPSKDRSASLHEPYKWTYQQIEEYQLDTHILRLAKYFQLNAHRLFNSDQFSVVLYDQGDGAATMNQFKWCREMGIEAPEMVGIYVTIKRTDSGSRHYEIYADKI